MVRFEHKGTFIKEVEFEDGKTAAELYGPNPDKKTFDPIGQLDAKFSDTETTVTVQVKDVKLVDTPKERRVVFKDPLGEIIATILEKDIKEQKFEQLVKLTKPGFHYTFNPADESSLVFAADGEAVVICTEEADSKTPPPSEILLTITNKKTGVVKVAQKYPLEALRKLSIEGIFTEHKDAIQDDFKSKACFFMTKKTTPKEERGPTLGLDFHVGTQL